MKESEKERDAEQNHKRLTQRFSIYGLCHRSSQAGSLVPDVTSLRGGKTRKRWGLVGGDWVMTNFTGRD